MINPILRMQFQTSLRNWKIYAIITAYVGFIAFISLMFINFYISETIYSGFDPQDMIYLYALLSGIQFGLILITVPALTAGSISGERERQTLDMLLITKMKPISIVVGKLFSSIGIILLMLIAAMPVYAVLFYFGGVSLFYLVQMVLFMVVTAFMAGAISIFFSTVLKKTIVSMVVVYLILGFLVFGTPIAFVAFGALYLDKLQYFTSIDYTPHVYLFLSANPGAGFFSLIDEQLGISSIDFFTNWHGANDWYMPLCVLNSIVSVIVGVIFLLLAALKINPLKNK